MNRDDDTTHAPQLVDDAPETPEVAGEGFVEYVPNPGDIVARAHWPRGAAFWTQMLRMEGYFEHMPALLAEDYRTTLVHRWLNNGRRTQTACELLDLPTTGRIAERQARLIACNDVIWLLLACAFVVGMKDKAIDQTCGLVLTPEERERHGENARIDDRNVAAMVLFDQGPDALKTLRVLNTWHSLTAASADLSAPVNAPEQSLDAFLLSDELQELLAAHHERFEALLSVDEGQWLLAINRRHKRTYVLEDDGNLAHGWEEETVVLHFRDNGRSVQISARSGLPSRLLASRIAKKYFADEAVHYRPDLASTRLEAIYAMLEAALDPKVPEIDLTGLKVKEVIEGDSAVTVEHPVSIRGTFDFLSSKCGDLLRRVACIKHFTIKYENRPFGMYIRKLGDRWVVQFADGRSDNFKAAAFRQYLWETYGVEVRSKATVGRWQ